MKTDLSADIVNVPSTSECAVWLKALAEPLRLEIVQLLVEAPRTVTAIAEGLGVEMSTASHHLQVMLHAGLVEVTKEGRYSVYRINSEFLQKDTAQQLATLDFGCCKFQLPDTSSR